MFSKRWTKNKGLDRIMECAKQGAVVKPKVLRGDGGE